MLWCVKHVDTIEGFPDYDESNMPIQYYMAEQDYYNEKSCGENVSIASDPKLIELKKSTFLQKMFHFDFEENKKYRLEIRYKSSYTNDDDNRCIYIQSNLFSFEFIHEVFIFLNSLLK
jgi:hypothetical protein